MAKNYIPAFVYYLSYSRRYLDQSIEAPSYTINSVKLKSIIFQQFGCIALKLGWVLF